MTRTQFLGLFAIPFLPKIDLEEKGKSVFNVKKLKERIAFLKKYPLTEAECLKGYDLFHPDFHKNLIKRIPKMHGND